MDPAGIIVNSIGVFVQVLFDKYISSKLDQWAARANLGNEFQNLRSQLEMANAILTTLKGSTAMEGLCQLAQELKSSAYDAEDVLDELDYFCLMEKVKERSQNKGAASCGLSFPSALQNVFHQPGALLLPPFKRARQTADCVSYDWDTVSCKMKSIADRLQRTTAHIERVAQLKKLVDFGSQQQKLSNSRQTSSLLTEPEVYGREEEKKFIVKLLLEPDRQTRYKIFSVLPIVGIGGVGKTTLIQDVYKDPNVKHSFDVRAWACVSDFLDIKQVTMDILQSIDEEGYHQFIISSYSLDNIQKILLKKLTERKFLIVLDDVWSCSNWELMCAPFSCGMHGSKIIITTRHHDIANTVGTIPSVTLRGLEDDPFWSFFKQKAFGDSNISDNLASIGRKIANKLNGIPLAAKTIGKLLHKQLTSEHWISILDSNLWELRQGPEDIMPALLLSYLHLPPNIQRCFAFCAAFSKDFPFSEEDLVFSWMAHGFIQSIRGDKTLEDTAREYLYELASASFFEVLTDGKVYRMHGLLHDLACSVAQDECFRTNILSTDIPSAVRHLNLLHPDQAKSFCLKFSLLEPTSPTDRGLLQRRPPGDFMELKNLRSLWFRNAPTIVSSDDVIWEMPISYRKIVNLRMLCLHHIDNEALLVTIGDLIHLRYLDLRFSDISELPESVCKLCHLQVLDIRFCKNLVKLPTCLNKLISIRHLLIDDSSKFLAGYASIPYIGMLTSLQQLDWFNVSKDEAFHIEQLKELREVGRSLSIGHLENVANNEEARNSQLKEKYRLNELNLSWSENLEGRSCDKETNILEVLQPHPNLKHLKITHYCGTISPTWLSNDLDIKLLESLHLQDCSEWKTPPPLGQLPFLKKLHFISMEAMPCIGSEFYGSGSMGGFPFLEELRFEKMLEWHSWLGTEETCFFPKLLALTIIDCTSLQLLPIEQWYEQVRYRWFPRLVTLHIENCPKLYELPPLPHTSTLHRISLKNVGMISSMELNDEENDDDFVIQGISNNLMTQRQYPLQFHNLRSVRSFSISNSDNFVVLPWKAHGENDISEPSTVTHDVGYSLSTVNELKISGSGISESILREILTNAGFLDCLSIKYCSQITSLELNPMTRLDYLVIEDCLQLRPQKSMQTLIHLRELTVLRSPKFIEGWKCLIEREQGPCQKITASLKRLHIDDSSFLTMPICSTITYLQYLMIDNDQQIVSLTQDQEKAFGKLTSLQTLVFNECPNLRALPASLHQISSLRRLDLLSCDRIDSLPHQGLPGSLERLFIVGCCLLTEKCRNAGIDENKIARIR